MTKEERNYSIDFIKVVSIIFILNLHYFNQDMGGIINNENLTQINNILFHILESISIIGVNCFVLCTGYLMINRKKIQIIKPIKLLYTILFYALFIFFCCLVFKKVFINIESFKILISTILNKWFVYVYICLYLLIPYINKFYHCLDDKQLLNFLLIMLLLFSIYPTFINDTTVKDGGYGIINFIILYMIGGCIKDKRIILSKKQSIIMYLICTVITIVLSFFVGRAWCYNSIFNILSSVALFNILVNSKIKKKIWGLLSLYTLDTYIIHSNQFITKAIYRGIFKSHVFASSNFMILHCILSCSLIFFGCCIIGFLKNKTFDKIFDFITGKMNLLKKNIEVDR